MPSLFHAQKEKIPSTIGPGSSQTSPIVPSPESPASDNGVKAMSLPIPISATSGVLPTNLAIASPSEGLPATTPISGKLEGAWNAVKNDATVANASRGLHAIGDAVDMAKKAAPLLPAVKATVTAVGNSDLCKAMMERIDRFSEDQPVFIKALHELKSLHPALAAIISTFEVGYYLWKNYRDNDKKLILLHVEMTDMMKVLFRLKPMTNYESIMPGKKIEGWTNTLNTLVAGAEVDLKNCQRACDAYWKKSDLAKLVQSLKWNETLTNLTKCFIQRRKAFEFELAMGTREGVDVTNNKLGDMSKQIDDFKYDIKAMFQEFMSSGQKQIFEALEKSRIGGVEGLREAGNLKTLISKAGKAATKSPSQPVDVEERHIGSAKRRDDNSEKLELDNLRNDIFEEPDAAIANNWERFNTKFEAQKKQIDELTRVLLQQSDRIVRTVQGSAHERIVEESIRKIWLDMNWRGHVKARHFVLALRDHYLEDISKAKETAASGLDASTKVINVSADPDAWAIRYIDLRWMQPIVEAFDDDASGFITINEVNTFTSSRPREWSLPHWMAFWAVGFKSSIIDYAQKIEGLFAQMEAVRTRVLPLNQQAADDYFLSVWQPVHTLTAAAPPDDFYGVEKFTSYVESEEARLIKSLQDNKYVIDGADTLTMITGRDRIEKRLYPLLYLLIKRHYEIMRIMQTKIVDPRELSEGRDGILCVYGAVTYRMEELTNNFSQQRLDPEKQFQTFAYGIFKYVYDKTALLTVDYIQNLYPSSYDDGDYDKGDGNEDQSVQPEPEAILNYNLKDEPSPDVQVFCEQFTDAIPSDGNVEPALKDLLGQWHGYFECGVESHRWRDTSSSMITLVLMPGEGEHRIKANGWFSNGRCAATGSWSKDENGVVKINFKVTVDDVSLFTRFSMYKFFNGVFDTDREVLTGLLTYSAEDTEAPFSPGIVFHRIPPCYLRLYPTIRELSVDKPRALWRFVIAAVRNDIRRDHWSWSYFAQRRDDRESVIPLLVRSRYFGRPLTGEEDTALDVILQRLTSADACFYHSKADLMRATTCIHVNAWCDSCRRHIGGARVFCIDCVIKYYPEGLNTLDLCDAPECINARITDREDLERPHEPTHRLVKVRVNVLTRNYGTAYTRACAAFKSVEKDCVKIAELSSHPQEETGPNEQKGSNLEPPPAEMHVEVDEGLDDPYVRTAEDRTESGTGIEDRTAPDTARDEQDQGQNPDQDQDQDQDVPTCGNCKGSLSFPFWYCTFCTDPLFICNTCDSKGVPDLKRGSRKHTEGHHLIRCLEPQKEDKALPTEQRLTSMEGRMDDLSRCIGDLTGYIRDLHTRIGNFEQLVKAAEAPERTA